MSNRALFWNSVSGTGLYATSVVVSFLVSPLLVKQLGDAGYGFWELITGLVGYLGILDLGVGPAMVRYVALAHGARDNEKLALVFTAGALAFSVSGLIGALLIGVVALFPKIIFGEIPISISAARLAIALGGMLFLLSFVRAIFSSTLMGLQYHRIVNTTRILTTIGASIAMFTLLTGSHEKSLVQVAFVACGNVLLEVLIFSSVVSRILSIKVPASSALLTQTREFLGFGVKSVGLLASSQLVRQGVLISLSHGVGAAAVTIYVLANRLIEYGQQFGGSIGFPVGAYMASAFGTGGVAGSREAFNSTTRILQVIQTGIAMGLWGLGLPFLSRWMGPTYAQQAAGAFYALCVATGVTVIGSNANRILVSLNQHGKLAVVALGLGLSAIAVVVMWKPMSVTHAGIGVALYAISLNFIELKFACDAMGISLFSNVSESLKRNVPPFVGGSIVLHAAGRIQAPDSYLVIVWEAMLATLVFFTIALFTVLTKVERMSLRATLQKAR